MPVSFRFLMVSSEVVLASFSPSMVVSPQISLLLLVPSDLVYGSQMDSSRIGLLRWMLGMSVVFSPG